MNNFKAEVSLLLRDGCVGTTKCFRGPMVS